jgi:hypothetical protein
MAGRPIQTDLGDKQGGVPPCSIGHAAGDGALRALKQLFVFGHGRTASNRNWGKDTQEDCVPTLSIGPTSWKAPTGAGFQP